MKRLILIAVGIALALNTPVAAQQAGDNINVLPVVLPVDVDDDGWPDDPYWYLKGDGYLQRQVEPTIGASTLNPDHMLAFFNDYRAVDVVEGDVGLGEGELTVITLKAAKLLLPPTIGSAIPGVELVVPITAAEAWIGGSRSYDGGYTWSGFFLPGAPPDFYDNDVPLDDEVTLPDVSTNAPIFGMEAATDPVLACGPCGTFYVTFVAFTRGGESKIAVARYRDTNAIEGGDTIVYEGMTVIESGNNAEFGYFLDKPDIEVDVFREPVAAKAKPVDPEPTDPCGHRVYVTYSTFNGLTKDQKVQTKMNFATSEDGGLTFTTQKINKNFGQNQGSAIAVDPRPGLPSNTNGGGTIYVLWRHFFDPNAMIWTKSTNFGNSWSNPAILTDDPAMVPFDQPTISITQAPILPGALNPGLPEVAFRSNGFPTAAVAANGTVFAAWQERVGPGGTPYPNGTPRIVAMQYDPVGNNWSGFDSLGTTGIERRAVDSFQREEPFDPRMPIPPNGPPHAVKHSRPAGPQVQPKWSFGGGRLMLTYYESRGRIANYGTALEEIESDPTIVDQTWWITGYDRVMDFRATLLEPGDGEHLPGEYISSAQISRYPIRIGADLTNGQDLSDVAPVNAPCYPDSGDLNDPICSRQVNRVNAPTSALGTSPWIGDYVDTVPYVQFVPEGNGWRWATEPTDVPSQGFHGIWTDNRHLIPPTEVDPNAYWATYIDSNNIAEWEKYQSYGPPGVGGACYNPGSRNTDVLTSRVDTDVIINTPTTFKQLTADRNFPFSISNKTGKFRQFEIAITSDNSNNKGITVSLSPIDPAQTTYEMVVFPYSSGSLTVFVDLPDNYPPGSDFTEDIGPIDFQVTLLASTTDPYETDVNNWDECGSECLVGTISFNAYSGNDDVVADQEEFGPTIENAFVINWDINNTGDPNAFVINNFLDNAFVINQNIDNAFVINHGVDNAFVINAFVINAFVINSTIYEITDTVWTMTPGSSNTSASYVPLPNIDNAEELTGGVNPAYAFQLIVDKPAGYAGVDACGTYNVEQQQILANVVQNPTDPNAFVINNSVENAFVINSQVDNAFVINSAFAIAPAEGLAKSTAFAMKEAIIDDSTKNDPAPNQVRITLRAFQLVPDAQLPTDIIGTPIKYQPDLHPASISLFHQGCDPATDADCAKILGADLVISDIDTAPLSGEQCGTVTFPGFTVANVGTVPAIPRGGVIRHGIYLSEDSVFDSSDTLLTPPPDADILSTINPLPGELDPERDESDDFFEGFGSTELDLTSIEPGTYTLFLFVDYPTDTSEAYENNNVVGIPLTVTAPDQLVTKDQDHETKQGVPLDGSVAGSVVNPKSYAPLSYAIDAYPGNGTVSLNASTGAFTYVSNPDFVGVDTFTWTVTYCGVTSLPATVTITVLPACDWVFDGLKSPLNGVRYRAKAGSVVPLAWRYELPDGASVDSSNAGPSINFKGWPGLTCNAVTGDPGIDFTLEEDPGSSDLRYSDDSWQFNWQSKYPDGHPLVGNPLPKGCYEIAITLTEECIGKTDGGFQVYLK